MSTRYVWGKYSLALEQQDALPYPSSWEVYNIDPSNSMYIYRASGYAIENGQIKLVNPRSEVVYWDAMMDDRNKYSFNGNTYFYIANEDGGYRNPISGGVYYGASPRFVLSMKYNSAHEMRNFMTNDGQGRTIYSGSVGQGDEHLGTVSNAASSAYPQNGVSGNYWYVYQGSDTITASSISYSTNSPMGGQPITITVAPANPTYGGNIRYNYQVQLDNGSWTTISSNNTSTTYSYTIPFGTNTFRARVQASDATGFTDSDYTTGTILNVTNNMPPSVPATISVPESILTGTTITISWAASTDTVGAALEGYILERSTNGGAQWTQIYQGSSTSTTNSVLLGVTSVMYRVKAYDAEGAESGYRTSSQVTVTQNTAPTTPSSITVPESIIEGTPYNVTWASTSDAQGNFGGYSLERRIDSTGSWTVMYTGDHTTFSDAALTDWTTVTYRVRAYDTQNFYSEYTTSPERTVIHNIAPTAPTNINLTNIVSGQEATISWGAASDSDGTIVSYTCQRSIDQNGYTTIYTGNALTCTDNIGTDWAVVSYRVFATDDDGANSPYTTSAVTDVNDGYLYITTGEDTDMGIQNVPWDFIFNISATGATQPTTLNISVQLDGNTIYENNGNAPQASYSVPIDPRAFSTGDHVIIIAATSTSFASATATFTFEVTAMDFPDGGIAYDLQDYEENPVFPFVLASMVLMPNGDTLSNTVPNFGNVSRIQQLTYTGTGTSGTSNPTRIHFVFEPSIIIIRRNGSMQYEAMLVKGNTVAGSDRNTATNGITITWGGRDVSWYSTVSANVQLNAASATYDVIALG